MVRRGWPALCVLALTRAGSADPAVGFQIDRFEPTPAGDRFFFVESPWYASTRFFAGDLTFDYAHDVLVTANGPSPLSDLLIGHLDLAIAPTARVAFSFSMPLVLAEAGTTQFGVGPSGVVAGDPRLGARVRLVGNPERDSFSLSASAYLWVPVGAEDHLAGDSHAREQVKLDAGGLASEHIRWAATGALMHRDAATLSSTVTSAGATLGSEAQLAAGAEYLALDRRLGVGPETTLSIGISGDLPAGQSNVQLEALIGAHYQLTDRWQLGVGLGEGTGGSPGAPDFRGLVTLGYTQPRHRYLLERVTVVPDENGHIGAVEVDDGKHVTLLDQAYASAEVDSDGKTQHVQASPRAVADRIGPLVRALPPRDRDGDGILDKEDACPDRAGRRSADPLRNGCPELKEKVVVLPDADGHVGGVEVTDAKGTTVLDKPYATSEVAADGTAHAVAPAPATVVEHGVAALAKQLPIGDHDGDGIPDPDDACPDRPGIASPDPLRNGCPEAKEKVIVLPDADGHIGGVEVNDGKTVTVLDKAYATAEVGVDGTAHAVPEAPPRAVEHSVLALAKQLPIGDRDHDGVPDGVDACPDRAGVATADPLTNGCPKTVEKVIVLPDAGGHVGGVEVNDGKTVIVLDKAYATAEVGTDGIAHAAPTPTAIVVQRSITEVVSSLPRADRDGDGILDGDDACPDRPGLASPDARHNGCPKPVETVIVIPDEVNHIGGVEVNDGKTVTLLDKAYATIEIGADGVAVQNVTPPEQVALDFAGALAARPPGARMRIYFNNRAQPAQDVAGPIANLLAEIKDRPTYEIDVVGHTDELGTPADNKKLGLERAQLVVDLLIKAGVPADRIHVSSKGATEPVIKHNRQVAEPLNRRVEVFVK